VFKSDKILLYKSQVGLLSLLLKFRFTTVELLYKQTGRSKKTVSNSLANLKRYGLVDYNYPKQYKLALKPAEYYLTSAGVRWLHANQPLPRSLIRAYDSNKRLNQLFIDQCIKLHELSLDLEKLYGPEFWIYTRAELFGQAVIYPYPDLYIRYKDREYYLDYFDDQPYFIIRKRLYRYFKELRVGSSNNYPSILLVIDNPISRNKAIKDISRQLNDLDSGATNFLLSNSTDIKNRQAGTWLNAESAKMTGL
jgi:hypothetical protein